MHKKEDIYKLYRKLLTDKDLFQWLLDPSGELSSYWKNIIRNDPAKQEAIHQLSLIFKHIKIKDDHLTEEDQQELWDKIEASINERKPGHRRLFFRIRYTAAVLILIVSIASSIYFLTRQEEPAEVPVNYEQILSELYVPYGKTASVTLSDGTKIWVNSGSKVIYPDLFTGDKREIYVDGEIYLEVAENREVPFIVKTEVLSVEVLGTAFNVSAYSSDSRQYVVLASGSISIKDTKENKVSTIRPNQKYSYEKRDNSIELTNVNAQDYADWRFGFLPLHNEQLGNVLKRIERHYNVKIDYVASRSDYTTLSGKLDLKGNIEDVFRILAITAPISYTIQDDKVSVIISKP
jgi:ferric-dicitrate binding protein FerR (iron transport regulator)